jgi:phytoene dehydrogenase-like protein
VETFDIGVPAMGVYIAATEPPRFVAPANECRTAVSAGLAGFPEDVIAYGRALADGRYVEDPAWVLVATPTLDDPSRAPEGRHTVKFLSAQSYGYEELKESQARRQLARVHAVAPNFGEGAILDMLVKAPEDIERANEHMIRGTFHGGNRTLPQSGGLRPAPGWAQYRMPIPGLYQTGGTTHPGGSITGAPGRNAAMVLLEDLGTSIEEVVANAGRARAGSR